MLPEPGYYYYTVMLGQAGTSCILLTNLIAGMTIVSKITHLILVIGPPNSPLSTPVDPASLVAFDHRRKNPALKTGRIAFCTSTSAQTMTNDAIVISTAGLGRNLTNAAKIATIQLVMVIPNVRTPASTYHSGDSFWYSASATKAGTSSMVVEPKG